MRAVLQRVSRASVSVDGSVLGSIDQGLLVLLGIGKDDTGEQVEKLVRKIVAMRIFSDDEGKMNRSLRDIDGSVLVVSQFTLYADTRKGNRPSFVPAADSVKGKELYELFVYTLQEQGISVETGEFGAMMKVELVNDGPVTIILETV